MRRLLSVMVIVAMVLLISSPVFAYMGPRWMGAGMGPGGGPGMGRGMGSGMGPGMGPGGCGMMQARMGCGPMAGAGAANCPMWGGQAQPGSTSAVTEEEAKALAEEYVKDYLPGYAIEKVSPGQGRRMVMYQVELKGPKGEKRILHVNPWGNVVPFPGQVGAAPASK